MRDESIVPFWFKICTILEDVAMSKSSSTSGKVTDGGPTAELEQLRVEARSRGVEWLLTAVAALQRDEVRKLAQAAGLPARGAGGGWIPVAELREALVKHLAPQAKASEKNSCVRFRILLLLFGLRPN